jgi:hypothetical protein
MHRGLVLLSALGLVLTTSAARAGGITGQYVEARTCDVWTGPCFANAEMNLTGKHAVLAWKVEKGGLDTVALDGLSVVAVVAASDTLGLEQTGPARALLIVDAKASASQRDALVALAKKQAGALLKNVIAVRTAPIAMSLCDCEGGSCARVEAGKLARVETRCLKGDHDKVCGKEGNFYPPLARDVTARAALAVEHIFSGAGLKATWKDADRRGAYVGSFEVH